MNITVYLGASVGNSPIYREAITTLGRWIGESGHTLVYGGSDVGLMGTVARSAKEAGAYVIGVEPQFFIDDCVQYDGCDELIATVDMSERKAKMVELGDAFIAFPGGTGTLEEITEIMSKVTLSHIDAPCIIYNLEGYYDALKTLLGHMVGAGFVTKENAQKIHFAKDLEEIKEILVSYTDNH